MGWDVIEGDCLEVMRTLPDASVDAVVTDPPAGIAFMGKSWDHDKGGRRQWIAWMAGVMAEALRVTKPGGHALVWALPRTSHWTATALEDAGWDVRDVVTHLFGSGFPKSLDVGKAIDKAAGAEREFLGQRSTNGVPISAGWSKSLAPKASVAFGRGSGQVVAVTAPATDAARQWDGWGTALKPASEHWILCRKPLSESTVAANVLRHGTGAINVDGCRIGTSKNVPASPRQAQDRIYGRYEAQTGQETGHNPNIGRFPANVILDEAAAAALDAAVGERKSSGVYTNIGQGTGDGATYMPVKPTGAMYSDTGGASRFFFVAPSDTLSAWTCDIAPTAVPDSSRENLPAGSAQSDAATSGSLAVTLSGATKARSTNETPTGSKPSDANDTQTIQSIERACSQELKPIEPCLGSLANDAGHPTRIVTTTTTDSPSTSDFFAAPVISENMLTNSAPGGLDSADATRFRYVAKASRAERNAGLEGMPEACPWTSFDGQYAQGRNPTTGERTGEYKREQANDHPTVKPLALMRWLCRLVTPPGGLILDPFCGSGSTGAAALLEGFSFVGIEQDSHYVDLARARIAHHATQPAQLRMVGD